MTSRILYSSVTGISNPIDISVSDSHESTTATAVITCENHSLDIGDQILVYLGYVGDNGLVFRGYVKQIEQSIRDDVYTITAHDVLIRGVDYFIASTNPESPLTYNSISAENLVRSVLQQAGLTSFNLGTSYFTFGINNPVEVNLVSAYDFSRMIGNLIAWKVWADNTGTIHFHNRKPYPMDGGSGQPDDIPDTPIGTITDATITQFTPGLDEKDLRNRVVVYGSEGVYASAQKATSWNPRTSAFEAVLPSGFYKTAVAASQWIDSTAMAQDAASYNLALYNRLADIGSITVEGNYRLLAKRTINISSSFSGISAEYYIFMVNHQWGQNGYTVTLQLRR